MEKYTVYLSLIIIYCSLARESAFYDSEGREKLGGIRLIILTIGSYILHNLYSLSIVVFKFKCW